MSVAAQEASLLFDLLRRFDTDLQSTLVPDFLTKAESLIADPWAMSALPDFIYPETTGVRPKDLQKRLNFHKGLGRLAARDASVFQLLIEVRNLLKPLTVLDDPSIVSRIEEEVQHTSELSLSSARSPAPLASALCAFSPETEGLGLLGLKCCTVFACPSKFGFG